VKVVNCNFDIQSIGVDYSQRNDEALNGKGSIYSPYLLEKQREFLAKTKGDIDSFIRAKAIEDSITLARQAEEELLAKYDFLPLTPTKVEGTYNVYGYVGRKKIRFQYTGEDRRTLMNQVLVEQLIKSGKLSPNDFRDSGTKIKLSDGTKIFGTSFTLKELKINGKVYEKVKCKMTNTKNPVLGYNLFDKEYVDFEIKDNKLWLLKDTDE
jgi:hypothetical protein